MCVLAAFVQFVWESDNMNALHTDRSISHVEVTFSKPDRPSHWSCQNPSYRDPLTSARPKQGRITKLWEPPHTAVHMTPRGYSAKFAGPAARAPSPPGRRDRRAPHCRVPGRGLPVLDGVS